MKGSHTYFLQPYKGSGSRLTCPAWKEHIPTTPVEERRDPMKHPTFLKMKELVNISNMEELALLIDDLDLELVGVKRIGN
jgi:hypothetical protein